MGSDQSVLAEVNAAFASVPRPERFQPFVADPEFKDHEARLQARDRNSLTRDDMPPGYDPMCSCSPEGIAYYFPSLAAIALQSPSDPWDWYGWQLLNRLGHEGGANAFMQFCEESQRRAVLALLRHIAASREDLVAENSVAEQLRECILAWQGST